jgi:molybdopterin converting factor small subunit
MPPSPGTSVRVLLLARYAELLGTEQAVITIPAGGTVADAVAAVRALPGGHLLPPRLLVARNLVQAGLEDHVGAGDELAFLPPMSGG